MLTVGAAHWNDVRAIEPYSSRGPTPDGRVKPKPDVVGADCGATSLTPLSLYNSGFCGTSQSAPHLAGVAALVRQRFPGYTPAQVAGYLKDNGEQRQSPDPNNTWGYGFAKLPPPDGTASPVPAPSNAFTRNPAADFNTLDAAGNWGARGIWSDGTTMWVADVTDDKIYAYHMPMQVESAVDRTALVALYNATGGAGWTSNDKWLTDAHIGQWHGVTTDTSGHVTELDLSENGLSGAIPTQLGSLTSLQELHLRDNQLSGQIPTQLGSLTNLRYLSLTRNQLTGCIPASLQGVESNDFDDVGLLFCAPQSPGAPTVSMAATSTPMVRLGRSISVTATFSEPVNGFTVGDVSVANGSADSFVGSDGNSVYTFNVTPNAIGVVAVDIAAGVATDLGGAANVAAVQLSLGLPYDDDRDGTISLAEAIAAVSDHFSGNLSLEHAIAIVSLYFASL